MSKKLSEKNSCRVTVVIKALNEEKRIANAIQSSLAAVSQFGGQVILADSCSTDRTVEIAQAFPVTIVQLTNANERCCGIGPQLGYQYSTGDYIYILDGDMEMLPDFLVKAVAFLDTHPEIAGVGGQVVEMNTESLEYISRNERASGHMQAGQVDRLDMGGLYRRTAVKQTGYFSNKNLHSYEEYDLGVRLRAAGWQLYRLPIESVNHYGHDAPAYELLTKRWKSGYICGLGEVVRAAFGKPHLRMVLGEVRELKIYLATIIWWLLLFAILLSPLNTIAKLLLFAACLSAPFALMSLKKKNLAKAVFSIVSWSFNAAGLLRGLFRNQKNPQDSIDSQTISTLTNQ